MIYLTLAFCLVILSVYFVHKAGAKANEAREHAERAKHYAEKADRLRRQTQGLPPKFPDSREIREGEFSEKPASWYGID